MLHKDPFIIAPETIHLIQQIQALPELKNFYLVGGTALALQLGHRNSIDIDLFTQNEFAAETLIETLSEHFKLIPTVKFKNGLMGIINEVKSDFIRHNYPLINTPITEEGITFLSLEDIAAMKINAISNSGKRLKDFIDIYFLLEHFTMAEIVECYSKKYTNFNPLIAIRAVEYFDDIDPSIDPPVLKTPLSLDKIKKRITSAVLHSKNVFRMYEINIYLILLLLFCIATFIQIAYLFILKFSKKQFYHPQPSNHPIPVSIIICAKNESRNLQQFLPFVLEQDYPKDLFEVIIVNDQSTDNSKEILAEFSKKCSVLRIIHIPVDEIKTLPGKKYALAKGIEAAKFERLLLTDADCKPSSNQWLSTITKIQNFAPKIILGYGAYQTKPGILNKFIRWETANTCMQYTSYAAMGLTYMGVGRNLSYDKSLLNNLEEDKAFQEIYRHTPSGDDDLLICKIANKENTSVCLDKNAFTISVPQSTWNAWWKQKTRHSSTGKYYPQKVKSLLGLYALSNSLYWFLGIFLLIRSSEFGIWSLAFSLFILRLFLYWFNAAKWYHQLNEKKILLFYPLGDLGWAIYNVLLSPYIFWKNKQQWK